MKKIFVSLFALAAISFSVTAQEKTAMKSEKDPMQHCHHKGNKHKGHEKMMKDMQFSDAQKIQLKANHEAYKKQMQALNLDQNITVKELNNRKAALQNEQKAKRDAILTAEQKDKMAQAKLQHEADSKQRAEKRLAEMKTNLSLSDDQVKKIKAQQESTRAQMKAIRENQTLDAASKKQQMMALKNTSKEQRKGFLTAEQIKKMEESRKDHEGKDWKRSKK